MADAKGLTGAKVEHLALSPDGQWLAAAAGKTVRIWRIDTGEETATLRGYQEPGGHDVGTIEALQFSPGGGYLAVGVHDNTKAGSTRLYRLADLRAGEGKMHALVPGHSGCTKGIVFSPDGGRMATWGCDGRIIVQAWDETDGTVRKEGEIRWDQEGADKTVVFGADLFAFTSDGSHLLFQHCGRGAVVDVERRQALRDREDWPPGIRDLGARANAQPWVVPGERFSNTILEALVNVDAPGAGDGPWLLCGVAFLRGGSWNYAATVYSGRDAAAPALHELGYDVTAATWSLKAGTVAAASRFGAIKIWRLGQPAPFREIKPVGRQLWNIGWSADGKRLSFGDRYHTNGDFDYNNYGPLSHELDLNAFVIAPSAAPTPRRATAPEVRIAGIDYQLRTQFKKDAQDRATFNSALVADPGGRPAVELVANKELAATMEGRFVASCWMPSTFGPLPARGGRPSTWLVGSDYGTLVEGSFRVDANGKPYLRTARTFLGHRSKITGYSVSPDRRLLATASLDGMICVWRLDEPRVLADIDFVTDNTKVDSIPADGPSAAAGVKVGDVVLRFGNTSYFERLRDVQAGKFRVGQRVPVTFERLGRDGESGAVSTKAIPLSPTPDLVEPLLAAFLAADGEWVVWSQDGRYAASNRGGDHVGWHINRGRNESADFFALERFQQRMENRAFIRMLLSEGRLDRANARFEREAEGRGPDLKPVPADNFERFAANVPPTVTFAEPPPGRTTPGRHAVRFTVRATQPLRRVVVTVNGGASGAPRKTGERRDADGAAVTSFVHEIDVPAGETVVEAEAETQSRSTDRKTVRLKAEVGSEAGAAKPRLFVLAVGVGKHQAGQLDLKCAGNDARKFVEALRRQVGTVFASIDARELVDAKATLKEVQDGLNWLKTEVRPGDLAIVLISGHGFFDADNEWQFVVHDTDLDPAKLHNTTLNAAELQRYLGKVRGNLILFADTCRAGAIQAAPAVAAPVAMVETAVGHGAKAFGIRENPILPQLVDNKRIAFAACQPNELSFEDDQLGQSYFTLAVTEFLRGSPGTISANGAVPKLEGDADGFLSCHKMFDYVENRVMFLSRGRQHPQASVPTGVPAGLRLARAP